jgi:hypothetical protein
VDGGNISVRVGILRTLIASVNQLDVLGGMYWAALVRLKAGRFRTKPRADFTSAATKIR